jgi:hypothetical protein
MPLRSARLTGDPFLESCLNGTDRIFSGRDGLTVMRLQSALLDVGLSVGPAGTDGIFGSDTGAAVTTFKTGHGLVPNDPVVGSGTTQALDDDLFFDPAVLDPVFGEFSPAVVDHRLEQFVARELVFLLLAPLDSWRQMLGRFTADALASGQILGITANSRAIDLRDPFLAVADPVQDGSPVDQFIDDAIIAERAHGVTVEFTVNGEPRSFILINDQVILGRAATFLAGSALRAPETLLGTLVHELTHARNLVQSAELGDTSDTDSAVFTDTTLAQTRTALTGIRTAAGLRSFVEEVVARHVHWVVLQELAGTPGSIAVLQLGAGNLAAAAHFYFFDRRGTWDVNDYGQQLFAQGDAAKFAQLAAFLRRCAAQSFSTDFDADNASTQAFQAAAQFCDDQASNPTGLPPSDGCFPLLQDFV